MKQRSRFVRNFIFFTILIFIPEVTLLDSKTDIISFRSNQEQNPNFSFQIKRKDKKRENNDTSEDGRRYGDGDREVIKVSILFNPIKSKASNNIDNNNNNFVPQDTLNNNNNFMPKDTLNNNNNFMPQGTLNNNNNFMPQGTLNNNNNFMPQNIPNSDNNFMPQNTLNVNTKTGPFDTGTYIDQNNANPENIRARYPPNLNGTANTFFINKFANVAQDNSPVKAGTEAPNNYAPEFKAIKKKPREIVFETAPGEIDLKVDSPETKLETIKNSMKRVMENLGWLRRADVDDNKNDKQIIDYKAMKADNIRKINEAYNELTQEANNIKVEVKNVSNEATPKPKLKHEQILKEATHNDSAISRRDNAEDTLAKLYSLGKKIIDIYKSSNYEWSVGTIETIQESQVTTEYFKNREQDSKVTPKYFKNREDTLHNSEIRARESMNYHNPVIQSPLRYENQMKWNPFEARRRHKRDLAASELTSPSNPDENLTHQETKDTIETVAVVSNTNSSRNSVIGPKRRLGFLVRDINKFTTSTEKDYLSQPPIVDKIVGRGAFDELIIQWN